MARGLRIPLDQVAVPLGSLSNLAGQGRGYPLYPLGISAHGGSAALHQPPETSVSALQFSVPFPCVFRGLVFSWILPYILLSVQDPPQHL